MSTQDMNAIAKKMIDQYNAIRRYMEATRTGNIHKLHDTIYMAFGLSPRTTKERLDALEAAGVFQVNGSTWKFLSSDNDSKKLLEYMEAPINEPQSENDRAFQNDLDKANRERHRAPQE